jgi:hypothetical protein
MAVISSPTAFSMEARYVWTWTNWLKLSGLKLVGIAVGVGVAVGAVVGEAVGVGEALGAMVAAWMEVA